MDRLGAVAVCMLLALSGSASAQTSPRGVKIIVATPAGGGVDILARQLAEQIGKTRGVNMFVENRPGGGTAIGMEAAARAEPDGNTVLFTANSFVSVPHSRKLSYDTFKAFDPVCMLAVSPSLLAVNALSPYRKLSDYIEAARTRPGEISLASAGPATPYHIGAEALKKAAGVNITYVPFAGATPAVHALLGQHVTSMIGSYSNIATQLESGQFRALAVGREKRVPVLPDVPTFAETYKGLEMDVWFGVVAPANIPKPAMADSIRWFSEAMQAPDILTKLQQQGLYSAVVCGEAFGALMRKQYEDYGRIMRESNIKTE